MDKTIIAAFEFRQSQVEGFTHVRLAHCTAKPGGYLVYLVSAEPQQCLSCERYGSLHEAWRRFILLVEVFEFPRAATF